nr:hypothetical protein CFP56_67324 [Quercus suber]
MLEARSEVETYKPFSAMHSSSGKAPDHVVPVKFLPVESVTPPRARSESDVMGKGPGGGKDAGTAREEAKAAMLSASRAREAGMVAMGFEEESFGDVKGREDGDRTDGDRNRGKDDGDRTPLYETFGAGKEKAVEHGSIGCVTLIEN